MLSRPPTVRGARRRGGGDKVLAEVASGKIKEAPLDDGVRRILRVMFLRGLFDPPHPGGGEVDTPDQRARRAARETESMVSLKNEAAAAARSGEDAVGCGDRARCGGGAAGGGGAPWCVPSSRHAARGNQGERGSRMKVSYALGIGMAGEDPRRTHRTRATRRSTKPWRRRTSAMSAAWASAVPSGSNPKVRPCLHGAPRRPGR